jgi:hypothetical protein
MKSKTLSPKQPEEKRTGDVAQVQSPEFKLQFHQKKKKEDAN